MQRAYAKVSKEMPDVKKVSVSPSNKSFLTRWFVPRGANAVTNPFTGNIIYNPDAMGGMSQDEIEQVMAHELTHTGQFQKTPWYKSLGGVLSQLTEKAPAGISPTSPLSNPYYWREHEAEAYQAERDRAQRMKIPNYVDPITGGRDINLRPEPKKKPGIDTAPRMGSPMFR